MGSAYRYGTFLFLVFTIHLKAAAQTLPAIPNRSPASYIPPTVVESQELDLAKLDSLEKMTDSYYRFKPDRYIPLNLPEYSSDGRVIFGRVLQRSLQTWVESSKQNQSMLAGQAQFARQHLNTKTQDLPMPAGHKLKVSFKPIYGLMTIRYSGPIEGSMAYYVGDQTASTEFFKPVGNKIIYLNRLDNYMGYATTLGVRWSY